MLCINLVGCPSKPVTVGKQEHHYLEKGFFYPSSSTVTGNRIYPMYMSQPLHSLPGSIFSTQIPTELKLEKL